MDRSGSVATVGLGQALSPRSALDRIKALVRSQQFQDGVKLFAIGAAVSASKTIADAVLGAIKRFFLADATFRDRDDAYKWILLYMTTHPHFQKSPRSVEVSARPSLLVNYETESRGLMSEGEIQATWTGVQTTDLDEKGEEQRQSHNDSQLGVHFFPASGEQMHFVFMGTHFWARRERQLVGDSQWDDTITLSILSLSATPLRRLIKHARLAYQEHVRGRVSIYRVDRYGSWMASSGISKRSSDSVHLPGTMKEDLLDDARRFIGPDVRQWYNDRGIPYRRGYLFHGPPGSGKSSLCHVLASVLEQPIYVLSLSSGSMGDAEFLERMSEVPPRSIVLMEDIDAAFVQRTETAEKNEAKKAGVSFSALLNAIDGVGAVEGRLLCITTNHIDRLDKALIRPGRVDRRFQFNHATGHQAREIFLRWYMPRDRHSAPVEVAADAFAQAVPNDQVSVAALQGFLLSCGTDYEKAVDRIGQWMSEEHD